MRRHVDHGRPVTNLHERPAHREGGATLIEFALSLPIIALLLFGAIDLGLAVYASNTVANAAREGARVAAVNQIMVSPDCDEGIPVINPADPHWSVKTCAAQAAIALGLSQSDVDVSFSAPPGSTLTCTTPLRLGCVATVTVRYQYRPITPFIQAVFPAMTMDSTSEMTIERVFP
jgi:Flp pilus assembly protein TadG